MDHKHRHFIINKPFGVLSQFVNNKTRRKKLLGDLYSFPEGTMAIGRLDAKSEGLLLLTTDGQVSELVRSKSVEKEYYAQLDGLITHEAIKDLCNGVEIGFDGKKYTTLPCTIRLLEEVPNFDERTKKLRSDRHGPTSWVSITLNEGKFRQVRKMTAAVGFPTLRLIRVRIGPIHLSDLKGMQVQEVLDFDIG